jgi:hypothetical protein
MADRHLKDFVCVFEEIMAKSNVMWVYVKEPEAVFSVVCDPSMNEL